MGLFAPFLAAAKYKILSQLEMVVNGKGDKKLCVIFVLLCFVVLCLSLIHI